MDRDVEDGGDNTWDKDPEEGNEVSPGDGLQDLQYFPNFYRLLRSLDSGKNSGSLTCFSWFPIMPFGRFKKNKNKRQIIF